MIVEKCQSCTVVADMPVCEDSEGNLAARCRYCGAEQGILFDTEPPLVYSEGTPSEGGTDVDHQTS